jgi:hypothetical protein
MCHEAKKKQRIRIMPALGLISFAAVSASAQAPPSPPQPEGSDEKLGERLIRKAVTDSDEDLMDTVINLMSDAAHRLEIDFDAGEQTQTVQHEILDRLNDAIKVAALQRRPRRQPAPSSASDKRRMSKNKQRKSDSKSTSEGGDGQSTASNTAQAEGGEADRKSLTGDLRELRRAWGHLPMREREEIIQGIGESVLERYREWVERYYRALQEAED